MGFLMGLLAEPLILIMSTDFPENFPFYFFKECSPTYPPGHSIFDPFKEKFLDLMSKGAEEMVRTGQIPPQYIEEIKWMVKGCEEISKAQGRKTEVKVEHLYAVNLENLSPLIPIVLEKGDSLIDLLLRKTLPVLFISPPSGRRMTTLSWLPISVSPRRCD